MKRNIYLLFVFLFLVKSSTLHAQYRELQGLVNDAPSEMISGALFEEEPFNYTLRFDQINDLLALDKAMSAAQKKALDQWLSKQESVLEKAIENELGKSFNGFREAQKAMFKSYEEIVMRTKYRANNLANSYYGNYSSSMRSRNIYTSELYFLALRKNEISSGNINNSAIGSLIVQNTKMSNIKSLSQLEGIRKNSVSSFGHDYLQAVEALNVAKGLEKVGWNTNILVDELIKDRVSHYNGRSLQDKIGLMTAYMISYNLSNSVQLPSILIRYQIPNYSSNSYMLNVGNKNAPIMPLTVKAFDPEYVQQMMNMAASGMLPNMRPEQVMQQITANRESEIQKAIGSPPKEAVMALAELAAFNDYLESGGFDPLSSPWLKEAREYAEKLYKLKDKLPDYLENELIEAIDNSFIFALKKTALYMNSKANITSETEKQKQFKDNGKNGVAILLYEFATGTGKDTRDFPYNYDITNQMLAGNVPSDAKKDFLNQLSKKGDTFEEFVKRGETIPGSYSFSPDHTTVEDSFNKHINANWVQFFIGGASAKYSPSDEAGWIIVELSNGTSRSSLLLHVAENYQRTGNGKNRPLSTTKQTFKFKLKIK